MCLTSFNIKQWRWQPNNKQNSLHLTVITPTHSKGTLQQDYIPQKKRSKTVSNNLSTNLPEWLSKKNVISNQHGDVFKFYIDLSVRAGYVWKRYMCESCMCVRAVCESCMCMRVVCVRDVCESCIRVRAVCARRNCVGEGCFSEKAVWEFYVCESSMCTRADGTF